MCHSDEALVTVEECFFSLVTAVIIEALSVLQAVFPFLIGPLQNGRNTAIIAQAVEHIASHMVKNVDAAEIHCFKGTHNCIPHTQAISHDIIHVLQTGISFLDTVARLADDGILQTVEDEAGGVLIHPDGLLLQAERHIVYDLQRFFRALLSGDDLDQGGSGGGGLTQCIPVNLAGSFTALAISVMDIPEVFVHITISGRTSSDASRQKAWRSSMFSTVDSKTKSAWEKYSLEVVIVMRSTKAADSSAVSSPLATSAS